MKFQMNGCLIIGTMDGANIEIAEESGKVRPLARAGPWLGWALAGLAWSAALALGFVVAPSPLPGQTPPPPHPT
jgi:hypothetical protein